MLIEVIATTLKEAKDIEQSGADRIELVTSMAEGGLTPSLGLIEEVCNTVNIPVNVMVRPHSKSFVYSEEDVKVILNDISSIKNTKANGIVFGCLTKENQVDVKLLNKVIEVKGHLDLTFHRAIDDTNNIIEEITKLFLLDIDNILTSGGNPKVTESINILNQLVKLAQNSKTKLLAGSGLYPDNVLEFVKECTVSSIHIGSGAKYNRDNLNEIDIELLSSLIIKLKK